MLANCRSQFLLDRLGGCLELFVSTDSRVNILPRVRVSVPPSILFITRKTPKNYREDRPSRMWLLDELATPVTIRSWLNRQLPVGAATTAVIGLLSGDKTGIKNGDNESLYLHGLKNVV